MAAVSKANITEGEFHDRAYWEAHITEALKDFYYSTFQAESIADIQKTPHNTFNAALEFARTQCVKRGDLLEYKEHATTYSVVQNEEYSAEAVQELCEAYISICSLFDRVPSLYGFAILSGIDRTVLYLWLKEVEGLSPSNRLDKKKSVNDLKAAREVSLSNIALTGGKSTIGALAHLNNEIWNNSGTAEEKQRVISLAELPRFTLEDKGESPAVSADAPVGDVAGLAGLPVLGVNTDI